ncbi:CLUMA_CG019717, isoform A [Clunio marinus]|uniref:CLUMA_CG019717, isoform A n=1 Tax=Clunio marinus TaxID=568069 RepID=A0A1J1J4S8_9DIPT|nr:CLUMA_CG019717, isoform A [Clunio marinus]
MNAVKRFNVFDVMKLKSSQPDEVTWDGWLKELTVPWRLLSFFSKAFKRNEFVGQMFSVEGENDRVNLYKKRKNDKHEPLTDPK